MLKPKAANEHEEGLLEYLEDIIGTIRYKPMLEEVAVEIDKTNEIRTEKVSGILELKLTALVESKRLFQLFVF